MSKVSIVIPNWNGAEKLKKHLPGVLEVAKDSKIDEVVVADDASWDNSVEVVKDGFGEIVLIEKKKNTGFGSNVDLGVKKAVGDLIVLLNSDASLDKDFLKYVLPHFDNPKVFSVGLNSGGCWSWAKFEEGFFWHYQAQCPDKDLQAHQTLWASGGSSVFRRTIWDELGGFDPLYDPFYVEDLDLGYRATKRGYLNIWEPKAKVEHYKEKGVIETHFKKNLVLKTAERNQLMFIWKNITSGRLIAEHKKALIKMLLEHPKYWTVFLAALKNLPKILPKRRREKREEKLSDEEVFAMFAKG